MSTYLWDPFRVLARVDRDFDDLVRRGWTTTAGGAGVLPAGFVPAAELATEGRDVLITLELPGVDVGRDVEVQVEPGRLVVRGERRAERSEQSDGGAVLVREFRFGSFRREFALPESVTAQHIDASYDAGMLTVRVRDVMAPEPTPTRVEIRGAEPQTLEATASHKTASDGAAART